MGRRGTLRTGAIGVVVLAVALVLLDLGTSPQDPPEPAEQPDASRPPDEPAGAGPSPPTPTPSGPAPTLGDDAGTLRVRAYTDPSFDAFTEALSTDPVSATTGLVASMEEAYGGGMVVFSPYWDDKLDRFDDVAVYIDLYAVRPHELDVADQWVLRDEQGRRLHIPWGCEDGTCPQYAGDPGDPGFRDWISARVGRLVAAGYTEILLDDVNTHFAVSNGRGEFTAPIDPRTGAAMTHEAWKLAVVEMVERLADDWPEVRFSHNSVWFNDSPTFDDPLIDRQIAAADLIQIERGGSDAGLDGGEGRFSLDALLRFVDRVHAAGRDVFFYHQDPDTPAAHEMNLAVHLLTSNGRDLVGSNDVTHIGIDSLWPGYRVDLGEALGPRTADDGLHRRDFTGGTVLVLEPDTDRREIELPSPMRTVTDEVVSSVTLEGGTARVLRLPCDTDCS